VRPGNLQSAHVETAPADSTSLTITACFDEPDNPGPRRPGKESIVSIPVNTLFNGDPASSRITLDIGGMTLMLTSDAATDAANVIEDFCTRLDPSVDYSVKVNGSEPALAITRLDGMVVLKLQNGPMSRVVRVAVEQAADLSDKLRRTQRGLRR
jgi:hypothetical protein